MIDLHAHSASCALAWTALHFPLDEPAERDQLPSSSPSAGCAETVRLDRDTVRALVDAGFMPLSRYIEMFGADADAPSCIDDTDL